LLIQFFLYTENVSESLFKMTTYYIFGLKQRDSIWIIKKRFNEFYDLHNKIKEQYPSLLTFEPSKMSLNTNSVITTRSQQFLEYLKKVLNDKHLSALKCVSDFIKPVCQIVIETSSKVVKTCNDEGLFRVPGSATILREVKEKTEKKLSC